MSLSRFPHDRLEVWHLSRRFVVEVDALRQRFPSGYADVRSQLIRAAMAVTRQIGEAASRRSAKDRRQRFTVAKGECAECDAILQTAADLQLAEPEDIARLRSDADQIAAMLSGLVRCESERIERGGGES